MLVVMDQAATPEQIEAVSTAIEARGYTARPIPGGERVSIGVLNNKGSVEPALFRGLPGVKDCIPITRPYKQVSREFKRESTVVRIGDKVEVGDGRLTLLAGPCAIESESQAMTIAEHVRRAGAEIFRGGAYKPRSSPYSFQGLGEAGLEILARVREAFDMPIVTEVMYDDTFDLVESYADMIQIGTRNMQNFSLLRRAGKCGKPILLKRGMAATIDEWLMAAEYILESGNSQVILCERGVRTFVNHSRNTLDVSAVPVVRKESHLPIIIDPSHAGGRRDQVIPLGRAAVAAEAHGLMVEVHHEPDKAMCDGAQSLYPEQFEQLSREANAIFDLLAGSHEVNN
ncbi:MAG: 3-deoxy-7-phosphoheptulonate synthase [Desulfobacterales bacterium]|nr:3-deoxy-7-phosphoheptulonate synthase [Desulfobacterales bacterium]